MKNTINELIASKGYDIAYIEMGTRFNTELREGVTGFSDFSEAKEFANEVGGEVCYLKRRQGAHRYEYRGTIDGGFNAYEVIEEFGDNCEIKKVGDTMHIIDGGTVIWEMYQDTNKNMRYIQDVHENIIAVLLPKEDEDEDEDEE